ncbi:hypothetical protein [Mesobacillus jeotgali]|uniref:hypothetical protein n=1 Tax=Mesobacillus jeotgali TaxID=129985 RepID=UPI001CFE95F7|nr:hypothetical protein [Mesobacillus jeotgali]
MIHVTGSLKGMSQVSYQAHAFYYSKIPGCQEMTLTLPKKVHCKILIKRLIKVPNDVADGKMGLIKLLVNNFCTGMPGHEYDFFGFIHFYIPGESSAHH